MGRQEGRAGAGTPKAGERIGITASILARPLLPKDPAAEITDRCKHRLVEGQIRYHEAVALLFRPGDYIS